MTDPSTHTDAAGTRRVSLRRVVLLRAAPDRVWAVLRDELPRAAAFMPGIDAVLRLERTADANGVVHTVHEWRATSSLAPAFERYLDRGTLAWIERTRWNDGPREARWTVESRLLGGELSGAGSTRLEPAMGGRGSRLQFEVTATLVPGALGPLSQGRWKIGLEDAAATLLAKTLQALGGAVERFLAHAADDGGTGADARV